MKLINNSLKFSEFRIVLFIFKNIYENKIRDIHFHASDFFKCSNIKSGTKYQYIKNNINNLKNLNIFEYIDIDNSFNINAVLRKDIYEDFINKKYCLKLKIKYDYLFKIDNYNCLLVLFKLTNNHNEFDLQEFKNYLNIGDKYKIYSDLKKTVIDIIVKNSKILGYDIGYKAIRIGRKISKLKFEIF